MTKYLLAAAAVAAIVASGAAFAGQATHTGKPVPMSDSQLDAVTAGGIETGAILLIESGKGTLLVRAPTGGRSGTEASPKLQFGCCTTSGKPGLIH
jgi:hypothetical protein